MQECALCLCEHYGRHLSDVIGYSKKGKKITVQMACIRKMNKLINRKTRDRYRNISFEALTRKSEPTVEMKEEVKQDYEQCDKCGLIRAIKSACSIAKGPLFGS